jgi:hypothetical protein
MGGIGFLHTAARGLRICCRTLEAAVGYDLYFRFRSAGHRVGPEDILDYFDERPNFECSDAQAWYSNENTGVYFSFDIGAPSTDGDGDGGSPDLAVDVAPVAFNLNYNRPHVFGLEAETELTPFVREFDLLVSDPQDEGMGDGEYSPDGFLRGWNAGNLFGYRAMLRSSSAEPRMTLPTERLEAVWRWNYTLEERQEALSADIFIPRIFFLAVAGSVKTSVAWTDGIPIVLPEVDLVFGPRVSFAPRKWLRKTRGTVQDMVMFTPEELEPYLARYRRVCDHLPAWCLDYTSAPPEIVQLFRSKTPNTTGMKGLAMDSVLNRELLDRARGASV